MTRVSRRKLLTTTAVAFGTGCLSRSSSDSTTVQRSSPGESTTTKTTPANGPTTETAPPTATGNATTQTTSHGEPATETPPPTTSAESHTQTTARCGELYEISVSVTVTTPEIFELSVATETVPYGGRLTTTLENTTETEQFSGNRSRVDIQRAENGSWESVLYTDECPVWRDIPVRHAPGEGFEWNVDIGPGVDFADRIDPSFRACEAIKPGTYRFVYWGVTRQPQRTNYALSAQFRLEPR